MIPYEGEASGLEIGCGTQGRTSIDPGSARKSSLPGATALAVPRADREVEVPVGNSAIPQAIVRRIDFFENVI